MTLPADARALAREDVARLPLHVPDPGSCDIDLADNTCLWGSPPAAMESLTQAASVSRYPSLYSEPLRGSLLRYVGMHEAGDIDVATGCGSDDVLDSAMRAFGAPGDSIAWCAPTFSMIPVFAQLNGLRRVVVPLREDFDLDAERLVDARARITYICAPNNPTGTAVSRAAVEHVVAQAVGIVIIDEAYAEFAPEVFVDLAARSDRVIVTRTFSKAFGLAGLRIGFGIGAGATMRHIERARGPYKVGAIAERAVEAVLSDQENGVGWVGAQARRVIENRGRLIAALGSLGMTTLPSAANFVMIPHAAAREIQRGLATRGVLVRAFGGLPLAIPEFARSDGRALRVGVGPWPMMERFLAVLVEVGT